MAETSAATEEEMTPVPVEERNGAGPGFILGMVLGTLAGAAAATLFAPSTGEEFRHRVTEEAAPVLKGEGGGGGTQVGATMERIRGALSRIRSRVQEASEEAREAARATEEHSRARYEELTSQEEPAP